MNNTIFGAAVGPLATYLFSILGLIGVGVYAVFRLKSTQIIREKVWSSFVGDKDFNDEELRSFAQEQLDLTRFRVVYGVAARSVSDLHRLLLWMRQRKIAPGDVKRIRAWIDPSKDELLETPSKRYISTWCVLLGVLILAFCLSAATSDSKTTMLQMKVSGTWFLSNGTHVDAVWGHWRIDSESCLNHARPDIKVTGLTEAEATTICNGIANGTLKTVVDESLKYQRWSFAALSLFVLLLAVRTLSILIIAMGARQLANRLRTAEQTPREPEQVPETTSSV
ncbi:DUF6216 family protein [Burkholderia ubonensis]|uniref:DUF6216 family protein n=1 Tax=Burkholderia ubonensis TaxID=101571 RepID=UPI000A548EBA|nr:DUF6216 family protein [Burkholderia ubonensis]